MNLSRFDDFYYTICKETGGIEGLFHSLFNFLLRKTDFFYEMDPGDKMGFPPGVAQKMVLSIFSSYQQEYYKKFPKKSPEEYAQKLKKFQEEKTRLEEKAKEEKTHKEVKISTTEEGNAKSEAGNIVHEISSEVKNQSIPKIEEKKPEIVKKPEENTKIEKKVDDKMANISTYNGGVTEKYSWSQSVTDVTVQITIPKGTKSKNLHVDLKPQNLKIALKATNQILIEGELYDKIKVEESIWSLEDEQRIILTLEKATENIWKTIIKGDQEIDATKVDNSKKLEDFDFETQGALRKIMYEQQRKNMGLPTTEEEKQQELLQKAWNAEGSPFKGTPFDPSKFNMASSNMNLG